MTTDKIKSAQNAGSSGPGSVSPLDRDRLPAESKAVRLDEHIDVAVPSDSLLKQPISAGRSAIEPPTRRELHAGLEELRDNQIAKTTTKWVVPTLLSGTAIAGGYTHIVAATALIGGAAAGPIGVVVGCVVGAVILGGIALGRHYGKQRAARITRDALLKHYDPSGPEFKTAVTLMGS